MNRNLILNTDSYKASHYLQYPPGTTHISSYIESRGSAYPEILFFGLQYYLKEYLGKPITKADIQEAEEFWPKHGLPFNREGWQYILDRYGGYLPLEIEAVPEGIILPTNNVLVQAVNTDPKCFWMTSYIETALLRAIWYPNTVATLSWTAKKVIKSFLEKTADSLDGLLFKLHDFGARGASSFETAGIGGCAHLVNFSGSDTVSGVMIARDYYQESMAAYSIPAAEHSTLTAWGRNRESESYANMLEQFAGEGRLVACVSDSYDIYNAVENIWGKELRDRVIKNGGTIVIRPDSGDPVQVTVKVIEILMKQFGYKTNSKGYKILPDYLRVIQGDGISVEDIESILSAIEKSGLSADNITFGMGGEMLQKVNRDTAKFAMKASAIKIEGQKWRDVYKEPVTDPGKVSKRGVLALIKDENRYQTIRRDQLNSRANILRPVFRNGELLIDESLSMIRERAKEYKCNTHYTVAA